MTDERALSNLLHETLDREGPIGPFQRPQLELEKSSGAAYRRRGRRNLMTRNRLMLLAAALVALLLASVLVGTRIYSNFTQVVPAGRAGIDQAALDRLMARPLQFQQLAAKDTCPDGPYTQGLYGTGPVYGLGGGYSSDTWGSYWDVGLITPPGLVGSLLLRGRDLRLGWPLIFLGQYGVGDVYGTDTYQGKTQKQFQAIAFDTSNPPKTTFDFGNKCVQWNWQHGFAHGWSGCAGFQIDGPSFTEVFYSSVSAPT